MDEGVGVIPENDLACRCRRREPEALGRVAAEYGPRIYRWAYARCGDRELAGDIMQNTLARFLQSIDRFEGRCSLLTWLYGISQNLMSSMGRQVAAERRSLERASHRAADAPDSPDIQGALDLVRGLRDDLRAVAILHYVEGLSLSEISDVLGLPASTIKWRLFEGRRLLRERLDGGRKP
jgi:RNA polymerase sigma-70 factor (ECF subfamily)